MELPDKDMAVAYADLTTGCRCDTLQRHLPLTQHDLLLCAALADRYQVHPTNGTAAGSFLHALRVHRAGIGYLCPAGFPLFARHPRCNYYCQQWLGRASRREDVYLAV